MKQVSRSIWNRLGMVMLVAAMVAAVGGVTPASGFSVDLSTLSGTYDYPIAVPPGIGGLQPGVGLSYNSGSTNKDWLGAGWQVSGFPYIENNGGTYYLVDGLGYRGKVKLIKEAATNRYHPETEDFRYYYYDSTNNYWYILGKDGTKYSFGQSDASRVREAPAVETVLSDVITNGGFESVGGWTVEKYGPDEATLANLQEGSGPYKGAYNLYLSNVTLYTGQERAVYVRQKVNVPTNATTLHYAREYVNSCGSMPNMGVKIGTTVLEQYPRELMYQFYPWAEKNWDIRAYRGQTVMLEFYLEDKTGEWSGYGDHCGWVRFDDVSIKGTRITSGINPVRWYLDKVTDTNNNTITYKYDTTYQATTGAIYPKTIAYNSDLGRVIAFTLEARSDSDYNPSKPYYFTHRIASIDIKAGSDRLRYYTMAYDATLDQPTISSINEYDSTGAGSHFATPLGYVRAATPSNTGMVSFAYSGFGSYEATYITGSKSLAAYTAASTPPNPVGGSFGPKDVLAAGQVQKVLIDDNTQRTLLVGSTLALKEGYVIKAADIDLTARTMRFSLLKDGTEVDTTVVGVGETYVYTKSTVGSVSNLPIILARVENVFSGTELQSAFLTGLFQISETPTFTTTKRTYKYTAGPMNKVTTPQGGKMDVTYVNATDILDPNVKKHVSKITTDNGLVSTDPLRVTTTTTYIDAGAGTNERYVAVHDQSGNDTKYTFDTGSKVQLKGALKSTISYKGAYNAATPVKLTSTENTWSATVISGVTGVQFPYISRTHSVTYNPANQANVSFKDISYNYISYGNVNVVTVYADNSTITGSKYIKTDYIYNVLPATGEPKTTYLVNTPKQSYVTDAASVDLARTRYYYDLASSITTTPTKGNVTKVESWIDGDQAVGTNWAATKYSYYTNGNLNTTTDSRGYVTTVNSYDSTYSTFPTKVTNAKGHVTTATYDATTGSPLTVTDPNGQITTYTYDTFKRPYKVIGPLDTSTNPTAKYQYTTTSIPWKTVQSQRTDKYEATAVYSNTYTFTDGFGAVIQSKAPAEPDTAARQLVTSSKTFYDTGLSRWVRDQYLPYYVASTADYVTLDTAKPKSRTILDALGRVEKAISPDGSYVTNAYGYDRTVTAIGYKSDGTKLNQAKKYSDGEGKLIRLDKENDYDHDGNVSGTYTYRTDYTYDLLGNVLTVKPLKADNATPFYTISSTYDKLGRVKTVTDPNAGKWSYAYDANGNVTTRTDARAKIITYSYDELSRITRKTFNSENSSNIRYYYDLGAYGKGRLYQVADLSGVSTYTYDKLGRVTKNDRLFDGISDGGFESGSYWSDDKNSGFPATSVFRGNWGTAAPHTAGGNAKVASNQAYGSIYSEYLASAASTTYTVSAYVRGSTDAAASEGNVVIRVEFYNASKTYLGYKNAATIAPGLLTTAWAQKSGAVSFPDPTTAYMKVVLLNYMNSGWAAFDDVAVSGRSLADPGFETYALGNKWTTSISGSYPGTSIYRGNAGPSSTPHGGSNAASISNLPNGTIYSEYITASSGTSFTVSAYARGEWDSTGSISPESMIGVEYYNSAKTYLCHTYVKGITSLTATWTKYSGSTATPSYTNCAAPGNAPANTAYARIILRSRYFQGWIAFDDVALAKNGGTAVTLLDPAFEKGTGWTTAKDSGFPATGFWRANWGMGDGRTTGADYSMVMSNLAYADINSTFIPASASTSYTFSAWMRGEAEGSMGRTWLYAYYYDINKATLGSSYTAQTVTTTYAQKSHTFTTPANTAYVRVFMHSAFMRGWVAYDDITFTGGGAGKLYSTQYSYDAAGRARTMTYPDGEVVTYAYNEGGLPENLTSSLNTSLQYIKNLHYNQYGETTTRAYGNAKTTTIDNSFLVSNVVNVVTGYPNYQVLQYTRDANGLLTVVNDSIQNITYNNYYDKLGRLTRGRILSGISPVYDQTYKIDAIGRIKTMGAATYTYGDAAHPGAVTSNGATTYTYDANGNMNAMTGGWTFTYDSQNQLIRVSQNGTPVEEYFYDASGNRVKKKEGTNTYLYPFPHYVLTVGAANPTKYYFVGSERLAERVGPNATDVYYYHPDNLGSPNSVTNSAGAEVKHFLSKPWGENYSETGTKSLRYKFSGMEWNPRAALYGDGGYYNPLLGRTPQPPYTYAGNNPVGTMYNPGWSSGCSVCSAVGGVLSGIDNALAWGISGAIWGSSGSGQNARSMHDGVMGGPITPTDAIMLWYGIKGNTLLTAKSFEGLADVLGKKSPTASKVLFSVNTPSADEALSMELYSMIGARRSAWPMFKNTALGEGTATGNTAAKIIAAGGNNVGLGFMAAAYVTGDSNLSNILINQTAFMAFQGFVNPFNASHLNFLKLNKAGFLTRLAWASFYGMLYRTPTISFMAVGDYVKSGGQYHERKMNGKGFAGNVPWTIANALIAAYCTTPACISNIRAGGIFGQGLIFGGQHPFYVPGFTEGTAALDYVGQTYIPTFTE